MIAELRKLLEDMQETARYDFDNSGIDGYARRLETILDEEAPKLAEVLKELAADEQTLRALVAKLEVIAK